MIVTRTVPDLRAAILERRLAGDSVGFVPTMGFLHEGQLSLVRNAAEQNGCVVVSCFVNPTVFSSAQELASYPRDEGRDLALLERERVDIVFLPDIHTVYPIDDLTRVTVE
ncbi:MAG: 4-phosphopantoate--beta-alanine ligase, partial [Chloroflexi bacterium]